MSGVDINLHRVKNVIVQKHTHDYEDGKRWFVTKDIIVVDKDGNEILKLSLFGDDFDDVRFQSQAEFDGLIDSTVSKIKQGYIMEKIIQDWELVKQLIKEIEENSDDELNFEED